MNMDARALDCISRQQAIEELETYLDEVTEYDEFSDGENSGIHMAIRVVESLPPVEPKIYSNKHNCIMTIFGECSYSETGCGSCEVVDKVNEALRAERPKGEWLDMSDGGRIKYIWYEKYMCNKCGERGTSAWSFCPNCGADMRGDDSE